MKCIRDPKLHIHSSTAAYGSAALVGGGAFFPRQALPELAENDKLIPS